MTEKDVLKLQVQLFAHTVAINLNVKNLPDSAYTPILQDIEDDALIAEFASGLADSYGADPELQKEFHDTLKASFSFMLDDIR